MGHHTSPAPSGVSKGVLVGIRRGPPTVPAWFDPPGLAELDALPRVSMFQHGTGGGFVWPHKQENIITVAVTSFVILREWTIHVVNYWLCSTRASAKSLNNKRNVNPRACKVWTGGRAQPTFHPITSSPPAGRLFFYWLWAGNGLSSRIFP